MSVSNRPDLVTWWYFATDAPMGQQNYEGAIQEAIRSISTGPFASRSVGSMRSRADLRFPVRVVNALHDPALASAAARRGRRPWPGVHHRLDLRIPPMGSRNVVTIHDLPPLRFGDEGTLPRWSALSAARADAVIVPSEFAAQEVHELLGVSDIAVIPYGTRPDLLDAEPWPRDKLASWGLSDRPYVVHAAGATERKNLAALADAWPAVRRAVPDAVLLLCGPPDLRRNALFSGHRNVCLAGRVPLADMTRLIAGASCVVVPSTYEGFGLPALEGMAAGAPVVAARRGALPEVCGDAALLVEPTGAAIAESIVAVLRDNALRDALIDRGRQRAATFSWERAAKQHLAVYDAVAFE